MILTRRQFLLLAGSAPALSLFSTLPGHAKTPASPAGAGLAHPWRKIPFTDLKYDKFQSVLRYGSYNVQETRPGEIRVYGWFLCEDIDGNMTLPSAIFCIMDQVDIYRGIPHLPRADVVSKYPGAPLDSGFDLRCPMPKDSFSVWILNSDNELSPGLCGNPLFLTERQ
jgi:hypothetical protein